MAKQGVVPDELSKPFWDAANEGRLVIQNCKSCAWLQHPPAPTCRQCGSGDDLEWKGMSGRGKIYNYGVVYDCPVGLLQEDLPFNLAVIMLDEDPGIQMYSHLPGTPLDEVPVGASVEGGVRGDLKGPKGPRMAGSRLDPLIPDSPPR